MAKKDFTGKTAGVRQFLSGGGRNTAQTNAPKPSKLSNISDISNISGISGISNISDISQTSKTPAAAGAGIHSFCLRLNADLWAYIEEVRWATRQNATQYICGLIEADRAKKQKEANG
jgi:hypothetical protein